MKGKTGELEETEKGTDTETYTRLKRELERVVKLIVDKEDYSLEATDRAIQTLCSLKDLKHKSPSFLGTAGGLETATLPDQFRCPISGELMRDPVVLATGQTYDLPFIQKWLKDGHRTCPCTQQVLSHTVLIPNNLVREMISQWCKDHDVELQNPPRRTDEEELIKDLDTAHLNSLLQKMSTSSSLSDQKAAAKEFRILTKRAPSFHSLFGESTDTVISQLLCPLSVESTSSANPDLQEDIIAAILNLSIHDDNKQLVAENQLVIPLLIECLIFGSIETRSNAAAALFTLSALDSNKHIIGKSGALGPLIELLDEGHPLAMRDAASAIFNLCIVLENKRRAVDEGAVCVILKKIIDRVLLDELLALLALLSSHHKAVEEMGKMGALPCLLSVIRGDNVTDRSKENCIAIVYTICFSDRSKFSEIREEENATATISMIAKTGTSRAKRKAAGILERLSRTANLTLRTA